MLGPESSEGFFIIPGLTAPTTCNLFMGHEPFTTWFSRGSKLRVNIPKEPGRSCMVFYDGHKRIIGCGSL